jgi:hypothetical protein
MRVFLCSFGDFSVAIPMHCVSSLALLAGNSSQVALANACSTVACNAVAYNREDRNTYVSLPRLFNLPLENIRHSIVLKKHDVEDDDTTENRTIVFIPEVECETEISDEEIFSIPQALCNTNFFTLFSGILFDSRPASGTGGAPILLLDAEQLIQIAQ